MGGKTLAPGLAKARAALREAIPKAAEALVALLDSKDERLKMRAAEAILNRAGIVEASACAPADAEYEVGGQPDQLRDALKELS